jgi:intracellular multiplication protein IcmM
MPVSNDLIELIKSQRNFYRDYYHVLSSVLFGMLAIIVLLSLLLLYVYINRPERTFYATCYDGKLMQLQPLDAPNYSSTPLI